MTVDVAGLVTTISIARQMVCQFDDSLLVIPSEARDLGLNAQ
jgi:hypothetical protein